MNRSPETNDPIPSGRRKLLRGTLSAPVILTLYSGSAMAGKSTLCLANAVANPVTKPVITASTPGTAASTDAFVRVRLQVQQGNNNYYVKGSDLGKVAVGSEAPQPGSWRQFDIATNQFNAVATTNAPNNVTGSDKYAAVRYDAQGNVVGVGASGTGSAVSQSCWNSFPSP